METSVSPIAVSQIIMEDKMMAAHYGFIMDI
jgi:hypothetical protein